MTTNGSKRWIGGGQVLDGAELSGCTIVGAQGAGVVLRRCKIVDCVFEGGDLSNAQLIGTTIRGTKFHDVKLLGIDWTKLSALSSAEFRRCVMSFGNFRGVDLRKGVVVDCVAREAEWGLANLSEADCRGTDFAGSIFGKTNLAKADFRGAKGYGIDPAANNVKKARFDLPEALSLLLAMGIEIE